MGWSLLAKLAIVLGACALIYYGLYAIYNGGYKNGYNTSEKEWREKQTEAQENKIGTIQQHRDALRIQGMQLQKAVTKLAEAELEGEKNFERGQDTLLDNIYAGRYKLYLPTKEGYVNGPDSGGGAKEGNNNSTEGRCAKQERTELHPETTANLFRITQEADKLAEDYNYLVNYTKLILMSCGATWMKPKED